MFGQSAGGGSADIHSYAWADDPIAHGFVLMSGTAFGFGQWDNQTANELWFNTSREMGCGGASDDHDKVFECMVSRNAAKLKSNIVDHIDYTGNSLPFSPTIDEQIVFSNYSSRRAASGPLLVGNTDFETGLYRLTTSNAPDSQLREITLKTWTCPAGLRAAESVRQGRPTWRYRYFGEFPNLQLTENPSSGAWHGSDVRIEKACFWGKESPKEPTKCMTTNFSLLPPLSRTDSSAFQYNLVVFSP